MSLLRRYTNKSWTSSSTGRIYLKKTVCPGSYRQVNPDPTTGEAQCPECKITTRVFDLPVAGPVRFGEHDVYYEPSDLAWFTSIGVIVIGLAVFVPHSCQGSAPDAPCGPLPVADNC